MVPMGHYPDRNNMSQCICGSSLPNQTQVLLVLLIVYHELAYDTVRIMRCVLKSQFKLL